VICRRPLSRCMPRWGLDADLAGRLGRYIYASAGYDRLRASRLADALSIDGHQRSRRDRLLQMLLGPPQVHWRGSLEVPGIMGPATGRVLWRPRGSRCQGWSQAVGWPWQPRQSDAPEAGFSRSQFWRVHSLAGASVYIVGYALHPDGRIADADRVRTNA
jgi:hypothetical protein